MKRREEILIIVMLALMLLKISILYFTSHFAEFTECLLVFCVVVIALLLVDSMDAAITRKKRGVSLETFLDEQLL